MKSLFEGRSQLPDIESRGRKISNFCGLETFPSLLFETLIVKERKNLIMIAFFPPFYNMRYNAAVF